LAGIGLLLTTRAKKSALDPELSDRLARQLGDAGVVRTADSLSELAEVVEDFKRLDVGLVACAGGDGTNHVTISGLVEVYQGKKLPYFAMLRGGTMNTVANSFGIPRLKPEKLLARAMRAYGRRALKPLRFVEPNLLRVGNHYGFIFGTGAIYGFIAEYNRRELRSPGWAARVLGTAVASAFVGGETIKRVAQRWEGQVRFDDGTAFPERDYLSIGASTCGQIGLGFTPFYRSGEIPDRFHILGIHASPGAFIAGLPRIWRAKSLGGGRTYEKVAARARLVPSHDRVPYMLDGDVYDHRGELEVSSGPRIRIVIP
jgi:diacylglycerol kinase family enzyme